MIHIWRAHLTPRISDSRFFQKVKNEDIIIDYQNQNKILKIICVIHIR